VERQRTWGGGLGGGAPTTAKCRLPLATLQFQRPFLLKSKSDEDTIMFTNKRKIYPFSLSWVVVSSGLVQLNETFFSITKGVAKLLLFYTLIKDVISVFSPFIFQYCLHKVWACLYIIPTIIIAFTTLSTELNR
jgi:hypothetical protein